ADGRVLDFCLGGQPVAWLAAGDVVDPAGECGRVAAAHAGSDMVAGAGLGLCRGIGGTVLAACGHVVQEVLVDAGGDRLHADPGAAVAVDDAAQLPGDGDPGHQAAALRIGVAAEPGGPDVLELVTQVFGELAGFLGAVECQGQGGHGVGGQAGPHDGPGVCPG